MTTTRTPREPLIAPSELARRLGISRSHLYRLAARSGLPSPLRLGGILRWDPRVIEEWLAAGARPQPDWFPSPKNPEPSRCALEDCAERAPAHQSDGR